MIRRTRTLLVTLVASGLACAVPGAGSAQAATTCAHDLPGLLEIYMSEHRDAALIQTAGGAIRLFGANGQISCAGAAPTTTNVDTFLIVDDSDNPATAASNDGDTLVSVSEPATLTPGKTPEASGASEIEFLVDIKAGHDQLVLGGQAKQQLMVGHDGAAWNGDGDAEIAGMPFDQLLLFGEGGNDYISGQGGAGSGAALSRAALIQINGGAGADVLLGSDTPSSERLLGGEGSDTIKGYGGDDLIAPGAGDDTAEGLSGADTLAFTDSDNAITVDLAKPTAQDTGAGLDTFAGFENVVGSFQADRLSGDSAANVLRGGNADDTLEGRGGADELQGDAGTDTVSYAGSPAAVNVDLARINQATDGDKLSSIEDLTGSPFADTLTGNPTANTIVGGAGADTVAAGDGPDRLEVRDGEGDRVSCGGAQDTAISDRRSLDALDGDCETVDALPEPPGAGGQPTGPAQDRALSFSLSGARSQRVLRQRALRLRVRCPLEACTTVASGSATLRRARSTRLTTRLKLRPLTTSVPAGAARTLRIRLTKRQLAALRKALAAGQRPALKVSVRARDAAGNRVTRALRITVKR